jgi:predicted PurR-regulated permease PerM
MPVGVMAVLWFDQFLEGNIITPNVVGSRVRINPFAALIALVIGGGVWGIGGMILFVPYVGILKCVLDEIEPLKSYGYLLGNKVDFQSTEHKEEKVTKEKINKREKIPEKEGSTG